MDTNTSYEEIIADIKAGLGENLNDNLKYLRIQNEKYKTHERSADISREISKIMYDIMPDAMRLSLGRMSKRDEEMSSYSLEDAKEAAANGRWSHAEEILAYITEKLEVIEEDSEHIYRCFNEPVEQALYEAVFKPEKTICQAPSDYTEIFGYYGYVLPENSKLDAARTALTTALKFNPFDFSVFAEYAEIFRIKKDWDEFEKMNREYLEYAYRAEDLARLYRNLGYVYTDKEKYREAAALYYISIDCTNDQHTSDRVKALNDLSYIFEKHGAIISLPDDKVIELLNAENIQVGPSENILRLLYFNSVTTGWVNKDKDTGKYYAGLYAALTNDVEGAAKLEYMAEHPISFNIKAADVPDYYGAASLPRLLSNNRTWKQYQNRCI